PRPGPRSPEGPPSGPRDGFEKPHTLSGQPNRGASGVRVYRQRLAHEVLIARGERDLDGDRAPFREGPADGVVPQGTTDPERGRDRWSVDADARGGQHSGWSSHSRRRA